MLRWIIYFVISCYLLGSQAIFLRCFVFLGYGSFHKKCSFKILSQTTLYIFNPLFLVWLLWINSFNIKVLCYLQCKKIWVVVVQNWYMFAKSYHLHWVAGRANILSKYVIYIFFHFGRGFYVSFPMLFPKAEASCCKKFWTNFCCILLLYLWAQKVCFRFLKSISN